MTSLIDYLGYILVSITGFIFRLFPISADLWIARRLGVIIYWLGGKRRRIAYLNIKAAMGKDRSPREIKRIIKRVYQNLTQTLVEVLTFPRIDKAYVDKFIKFEGIENLKKAKASGKGIIFLTAHYGDWELFSIAGGLIGYRMLVLAREQKHSHLNGLINKYRELTGSKVIKKGFAIKDMLLALRDNEIIGMLVDQDAGKKGVFVDFFGRKTSFAHGPISFALKTDATVLPTFIVREKGPYHRIIIERPIQVDKTENREKDVAHGLQKFAKTLEFYIRQRPEQWLWVHKRWKSTPTRKILILNDGRAGHLNQSIAVAEIIQKYRKDNGFQSDDTQYKVVDVNFKNSASRCLFNAGSAFSAPYCQGCAKCLKFCLTKKSYENIIAEYADIVISCGSSLEKVNLFLAKELRAKNIIIMKPSLSGLGKFKLVIAPRHDRLKEGKNVIITEGAPNRMNEKKLKSDGIVLAGKINLPGKIRIGVLIGGDSPEYKLPIDVVNKVIDQLISLAGEIDADLLVTTSRRTPEDVDQMLKAGLGSYPRCRLLVIANEKNMDEAVGGILGLCHVVLVTCESISMISEAKAAFNYTLVLELEKRRKARAKHEIFLENLVLGGYIEMVRAENIARKVKYILAKKPQIKKIDDNGKVYEAVGRIL
ncbi:MAG: hypothetical protein COS99_03680 [Candidatus Omnitrophica bacterium CG07_land_8_20_14_0_80_42_15]|uniref:Lipid A biosynthesis acyltransferase n=1 Tax=Candidatus Aquitaenariimonas noxiae TaxID=1974741 RepID=A0A2J0KTE9_9BACT|nr:MAG: hypothetical protein COS99_03680 [Candidatus Omnitrophica bacterium CG07_land_8_20_14_0_80_42_15]